MSFVTLLSTFRAAAPGSTRQTMDLRAPDILGVGGRPARHKAASVR
jgi:hypothetical protein